MRKIRDADHKDIWDAYEASGSSDDKAKIIEAYFPLVKYLAERMASTLPASVETDDLISMGTFGLIEAIDRFDRSRNIQFKTYCTARIRGAILDNLRTNDWVPRLVRLRTNIVDKTLRKLYAQLGREPTDPEMAEELEMTMPEYEKLRKEATPTSVLSLTDDSGDDGEGIGWKREFLSFTVYSFRFLSSNRPSFCFSGGSSSRRHGLAGCSASAK